MDDTTTDPEPEPETALVDPEGFGPETIDGKGPADPGPPAPSKTSEPGDPELDADPETEPTS